MGIYSRMVFPFILERAMNLGRLTELRHALLAQARGTVVEIGFGTGANLPHYPSAVTSLSAIEPNEGMRRYWSRKTAVAPFALSVLPGEAERLPLGDKSCDTAVSTLTLCSVRDPARTLSELFRVLKPGGQLLFLEHGRAPDRGVLRWQMRLEPVNRALADGCNLTRDMAGLIGAAGFRLESLENFYLPKSPRTHGYLYQGRAIRA
ncbi:MAG: class I SAM-dependent methyltransferase [Oligoflexia bacterium]|nr:class I SAM-dependent methyltransferase [Oligoflexia bacterium]